jgi:hypothetical protein
MTTPIHKTCYRCGRAVPEFVEPADVVGGLHGACSDCRLTLGAREVARRWHAKHPELPCAPGTDGGVHHKGTETQRSEESEGGVLPTKYTKAEAGIPRGIETLSGSGEPVQPNDSNPSAPADR